jgi:acetyl-CoA C-acetyltransferase/acetyl-CoA acyltransferase
MILQDAHVYDAVRTPRGKGKDTGALAGVMPHELVAQLLTALSDRNGEDVLDTLDGITLGCVGQVGTQGGNIALVSRLHAGLPATVPAQTINNYCVSGLTAAGQAGQAASAGAPGLMAAGGIEMMSQVPFMGDKASYYTDPAVSQRLKFAPVALSADLFATRHGISKTEIDSLVAESHRRAHAAWEDGRYAASVIPVRDDNGETVLDRDELIRPGLDTATLEALEPAFAALGAKGFDAMMLAENPDLDTIEHVHSVADCPGVADGAALCLVGSAAAGKAAGLKPKARIRAHVEATGDPVDQLTAGFAAMDRIMAETGLSLGDFDRIEFMEAFGAVPVRFLRDYGPDPDKVNVNGGHLAMGHPMGATGAVLLATMLAELERAGLSRGLIVAHGGSGVGSAMVVERER